MRTTTQNTNGHPSSKLFLIRGRDWQSLPSAKQEHLVEAAFRYWRSHGFPFYTLTKYEYEQEFDALARQPRTVSKNGVTGSNVGLRVANSFHPQMWSVRVSRYRSPMDVFQDDVLLRAAIRRSWVIWPDRFGANPATLRRMLKTFPSTASVSNFRPTIARRIIANYSDDGNVVVDFAGGYGGRMVGCLTLRRHYIGVEPCNAQFNGLRRTISELRRLHAVEGTAELQRGCAEVVLRDMEQCSAHLVFSSPPYFDWEKYSSEPSQSYVKFKSYKSWLEGFLQPVIAGSSRVLKRGGRLILNISGRRRRPSIDDVQSLAVQCGLTPVATFPFLIARVPYLHPRGQGATKAEVFLVFKKS
jgi:hypothetical protein